MDLLTKTIMNISDKITNNPIISLLILCSIVVTSVVSIVTWLNQIEKRNILSKHSAEIAMLRNEYEQRIIKKQTKSDSLSVPNNTLKSDIEELKKILSERDNDIEKYKNQAESLLSKIHSVQESNEQLRLSLKKQSDEIEKYKNDTKILLKGNVSEKISKPTKESKLLQNVEDILFELNQCSMSGNIIKCSLSIKNNRNNDTNLAITHGVLFDQNGVKYAANRVSVGGHATGWMKNQELISGIKTMADIAFDVSKGNVKRISALKFYTHGAFDGNVSNWGNRGAGARLISFKDISL